MKCCFFKIIVTCILVFILYIFVLYWVRSPITAEYWVHQMMVLKRHQVVEIKSPKIIILGGSNALFGIDASEMEKELKTPTYNYGLHAGMRLEWILEEGRFAAKPGDIMVLVLEPTYYVKKSDWSEWTLRNALAWHSKWIDGKGIAERFKAFCEAGSLDMTLELVKMKYLLLFSGDKVADRLHALESDDKIVEEYNQYHGKNTDFSYSFLNIDKHGTMSNAENAKYFGPSIPFASPEYISPYSRQLLSQFLKEMKVRNVRVYFANSPYVADGKVGDGWKESDREFCKEIHDLGADVIDRREQLVFPRNYFFDTYFHLNTAGKYQRTKILIEALKQKLNSMDHPSA